jgi:hypothetical protein
MVTMDDGREALRNAQGNLVAAEVALTAARATTGRARAMLEEIVRESERLDAEARRAADALADKIRSAIEAGAAPPAGGMSKNAAAGAEVVSRRVVVERIVADFSGAEHHAEEAVESARAAVERAVQDILRLEVEAIAEKWAEADAAARSLRIRLGREGDPVWRVAGESDVARRATNCNFQDADFDFRQQQAASAPWLAFASALLSDPNARLEFSSADLAIEELRKESAARRAANARWVPGEAA